MAEPASPRRTLYGFWLSPYMSQVAHLLTEAGLGFDYERVSPYLGDTLAPRHRSRNALGKIPCLVDVNGAVVSESQAISRYLARTYPELRRFYPVDDPIACARVDTKNDFVTFSIGGAVFNWFVFSAYFPKAWGLAIEDEARVFGHASFLLVRGALARLVAGSEMAPFLLGAEPSLPDYQLFHTLEVGRTFSGLFDMPAIDLARGDAALERLHAAMCERPATQKILREQAAELPLSRKELFEDFGPAYGSVFDRRILEGLFGHAV